MKVTYSEYQASSKALSRIKNEKPNYIPSMEEVDFLIEYTKKPRLYPQSIPTSMGRKYDYESKIRFVEGTKLGESCIEEESLCMYLLFLANTAIPENEEQEKNLEYIKAKLKELIIIEGPDKEEEVSQ